MKKFVIGVLILGVLVLYSVGIRHQQPKISPPRSLITDNSPGTTMSDSGKPPTSSSPTNDSSTVTTNGNTGQGSTGSYKDGSYTSSITDAYYGNVQVKATISGGKITGVTFLKYPNTHSTSVYINQQAMPYLQQEAIKVQNANVNIVSGATYTSEAFIQALSSALSQAS